MTFPTAEVALVVSVAVAVWQVWQHRLQGGRVRVKMRPIHVTDWGSLHSGPERGWSRSREVAVSAPGRYNVELAEITVENLGRTAVTVAEIGLDFGRPRWWRPGRHTVVPIPVELGSQYSTARSVRLEPFDETVRLVDLLQQLPGVRDIQGSAKTIRVRASARVAGKRWRRRSALRKAWRLPPGCDSLWPRRSPSFSEVVYRVTWRHLRAPDQEGWLSATLVASAIEPLFDGGRRPTQNELESKITEALEHHTAFVPPHMIAHGILRETEGHEPDAPAAAAGQQRRTGSRRPR